jgi:hypothetical protein
MSRESSRGNLPAERKIEGIPALLEEIEYRPTKQQEIVKARFWQRVASNPLLIAEELSLAQVSDILGSRSLEPHWNKPGFREWFLNRQEHRERIEQLFSLALHAAEGLLLSEDPKTANAKVNILRVLAELASKKPKETDSHKDPVSEMSKQELEEFLAKSGVRIERPVQLVVDSNPEKK